MSTPKFSVCIPVYNGSEYLHQCIDSILSQTFTDFEIVIVDDCSTDSSEDIVKEYQKLDGRIRYYKNQTNLGLVKNWNTCIHYAEGSWIKFVFQDDYIENHCLATLDRHTDSSDFIFHKRKFLLTGEVETNLYNFYTSEKANRSISDSDRNFSPEELSQRIWNEFGFNFFGEPSNVAFAKRTIDKIGYFNNTLIHLCDYEFWIRLASNNGGVYIADTLSTFRVHAKAESTVNTLSRKFRYQYLDKLIVLHELISSAVYSNFRKSVNSQLKDLRKEKGILIRKCSEFLLRTTDLTLRKKYWKELRLYANFSTIEIRLRYFYHKWLK